MKTLTFTRGYTNKPTSIQFAASRAPKNLVTALVLSFALSLAAQAKTIVVPLGAVLTIQDGVNAAAPGDTVLVQPGTYLWGATITTSNVTLKADGSPGSVKVIGGGLLVIWIRADYVTVEGFDISGGAIGITVESVKGARITGNTAHDTYRGIMVGPGTSAARIDHNNFYNDSLIGILIEGSSDVRIDHNIAENNQVGFLVRDNCSSVQIDHNRSDANDTGFLPYCCLGGNQVRDINVALRWRLAGRWGGMGRMGQIGGSEWEFQISGSQSLDCCAAWNFLVNH